MGPRSGTRLAVAEVIGVSMGWTWHVTSDLDSETFAKELAGQLAGTADGTAVRLDESEWVEVEPDQAPRGLAVDLWGGERWKDRVTAALRAVGQLSVEPQYT